VIIDRIFTPGLAQVAYLVADETAREVAVIDPRRDVQIYVDWAAERDFTITAVLETHIHADFVSGSIELARATGAPIYASWLSEQSFAHIPLSDRGAVAIGSLVLSGFWTPGHTPEHLSWLLVDPARGPNPVALFSGDSLFVGDVGRPDLLGPAETEALATRLYYTVNDRLGRLADEVIVYPGHTAGSSCGKKIGSAPQTTIGAERFGNYAFQARSRDSFVRMVLDDMPPAPAHYAVMKKVNRHGASLLADLPVPELLDPAHVESRAANGAAIIDARPAAEFSAGHIPGAVAVGLGGSFVAWMGWLAPYDRDVILVLPGDERLDEAVTDLRRIGIDRVAGYLGGGMRAWEDAGKPIARLEPITVGELAERLRERKPPQVLDVRSGDEWRSGHIAEAVHCFAGEIATGDNPPLDPDAEIATICTTGYRATFAASLLERCGYRNLVNVTGGMDDWQQAKLPVVRA
jgi:hydroxyacylglutathione hydrolase